MNNLFYRVVCKLDKDCIEDRSVRWDYYLSLIVLVIGLILLLLIWLS